MMAHQSDLRFVPSHSAIIKMVWTRYAPYTSLLAAVNMVLAKKRVTTPPYPNSPAQMTKPMQQEYARFENVIQAKD